MLQDYTRKQNRPLMSMKKGINTRERHVVQCTLFIFREVQFLLTEEHRGKSDNVGEALKSSLDQQDPDETLLSIQLLYEETRVYTPGKPSRAHSMPKLTTPIYRMLHRVTSNNNVLSF